MASYGIIYYKYHDILDGVDKYPNENIWYYALSSKGNHLAVSEPDGRSRTWISQLTFS